MGKAKNLVHDIKQYIDALQFLDYDRNLEVYNFLTDIQARKSELTRPDFPDDGMYFMYKRYHQKATGEYDDRLKAGVKAGEKEFTENNFEKVQDYLKMQLENISMVTREF